MTTQDIIESAIKAVLYRETTPTDFLGKLLDFRKRPSRVEEQSAVILHLSNRISAEMDKVTEAEKDAHVTVMEAIHIMEQYSPEATKRLWELREKRLRLV